MYEFWQRVAEFIKHHKLEKRWRMIARSLAVIVVFCTTYMLILPAVTMDNKPLCGFEEHTHGESCYSTDGSFICSLAEHTHEEFCFIKELATMGNATSGNAPQTEQDKWEKEVSAFELQMKKEEKDLLSELSAEEREEVMHVLCAIDKLPDYDEFFEKLDRFYDSDDMEGEEKYILEIQNLVTSSYCAYQPLGELQKYIYNSDKMFELIDIFSNMPQTYTTGTSDAITFNYVNSKWSTVAPVVVHGGNVGTKCSNASQYWHAVVIEYNSQRECYEVSQIYIAEGKSASDGSKIKALKAETSKGFVLVVWSADSGYNALQKSVANQILEVEEGDVVEVSVDPTTLSSGYKAAGYGTITFKESSETEKELQWYKNTSEPSDSQILFGGGEVISKDGKIVTTKTINGTSEENVFDITLTVQTQSDIQTFLSEPDMAVVVVMDISNTMNTRIGASYYGHPSRYDAAVEAAENFINQFAVAGKGLSQLGFVAFNTSAHEIISMQPCTQNNAAELIQTMKTETANIIDNYTDANQKTRYTNIEGGLKRGYDMIRESGNSNQYIVFLSDGFPTTYLKNNALSSTDYSGYEPYTPNATKSAEGAFFDDVKGWACAYGTSYSDRAAIKARQMATTIKNSGAKIFSIGVDVAGQTVQKHVDYAYTGNGVSIKNSIVDRTSTTYEIGGATSTAAYQNWLKDKIGSGYYYDSNNSAQLYDAFEKIFDEIRVLNEQTNKTVWTATDPMPVHDEEPSIVGFINFYDKNDNPVKMPGGDPEKLTGKHEVGGENSAYHENHVVHWDLKSSGYTTQTVENVTYYYYKLKYRVRLVNEKAGTEKEDFVDGKRYETNGAAYLEYRNLTETNGVQQISEVRSVSFMKPAVKGYLSNLSFSKQNNMGVGLKGAEFELTHADSCNLCHGDGTAITDNAQHNIDYVNSHAAHVIGPYRAQSDEDGKVTFTNIPSGHTYILTETKVPDGYDKGDSTYSVNIAYDVLTVTETLSDGTTKIWSGLNNVIYNYGYILPETGGIGTHQLYIIGGLLSVLSSVFLLCYIKKDRGRRRKGSRA